MYQKVNERVELGVLSTWSAVCDVSAGAFALAAKYQPTHDSLLKVCRSEFGCLCTAFSTTVNIIN